MTPAEARAARDSGPPVKHPGAAAVIATGSGPTAIALLALDEASRYLLQLLLVLAGLCLIAGPLLYYVPIYRRRRNSAGGSE